MRIRLYAMAAKNLSLGFGTKYITFNLISLASQWLMNDDSASILSVRPTIYAKNVKLFQSLYIQHRMPSRSSKKFTRKALSLTTKCSSSYKKMASRLPLDESVPFAMI